MARKGIEAEKQFDTSYRRICIKQQQPPGVWGVDQTMHLLMVVLRWLIGLLACGVHVAWPGLARVPAWALGGPVRRGFSHPHFPRVGRKRVRLVLEEPGGPPGCQALGAPVACHRGWAGRFGPVRPEHVLRGRLPARCGYTDPSRPALPVWG